MTPAQHLHRATELRAAGENELAQAHENLAKAIEKRSPSPPRSEDSKLSKASVDYSPGKGDTRCRNCAHFDGDDACALVAGEIDPDYWCKRFANAD